jgi:hypothetical protein
MPCLSAILIAHFVIVKYEFRLIDNKPIVGHVRPIPLKLRPIVKEHIEQLLKDDITEISNSPFFNPLTVVPREGKTPRICVDAIKINVSPYLTEQGLLS